MSNLSALRSSNILDLISPDGFEDLGRAMTFACEMGAAGNRVYCALAVLQARMEQVREQMSEIHEMQDKLSGPLRAIETMIHAKGVLATELEAFPDFVRG